MSKQGDVVKWIYADRDPDAVDAIERRLAETACREGFITYSDLVRGIVFSLTKDNKTQPFKIDTDEWFGHERQILGDYLGYIAYRTFLEAGFLASSLAVSKTDQRPSRFFFDFAREIDAMKRGQDPDSFWLDQAARARAWYRNQRRLYDSTVNAQDQSPGTESGF